MAKSRRFSQFKSFILEPILTPSAVVDTGFEENSDGLMDEGFGGYNLPLSDGDELELSELETVEVEAESVDVVPAEIEVSGLGDEIEIIDYIDPWLVDEQGDYIAGVFTVEDSGYVSIDYLFDGGKYSQGELAIFSLEGMTEEPGSRAFIQEAARRALSSSELGHVVISDATDGARFSNTGSVDFNVGEYRGVRTFQMNGGDRIGFMLAPNHSIQQVYDGEAWRPLFSMATANPDDHFQFGQIADVTGDGSVYTMEDISLSNSRSDRDYNDLIFQVRGATAKAPLMDEVMASGVQDWRSSAMGQALLEYTHGYLEGIDFTAELEDFSELPLMAVIAPPEMDIDLPGGNAPQDWVNELFNFVENLKEQGEDRGVVALEITFPKIGDFERSEFTYREMMALRYAQSHNVAIALTTSEVGVITALEQVAPQFQNVITVGAAELTQPELDPFYAYTPSADSVASNVLDLLARDEALGTLGGAATQVAEAATQVWAANPNLHYTQVLQILRDTAMDLGEPGRDAETGMGLLNVVAAIHYAQATRGLGLNNSAVPLPPSPLYVDRFFNPTEPIHLIGAVDEPSAVEKIAIWAQPRHGGEWQYLGDGVLNDWGQFEFKDDTPLPPGHYHVKAIVHQPSGRMVESTPEVVTVLSLPAGSEFSYRVKSALERTIDLTNYTNEVLRKTPDWLVSIQAGQNADALAQEIGAVNRGTTNLVENTFRWEMPTGMAVEDWINWLNSQEFIEYAYPLVTSNPQFYSPDNEPFVKNTNHEYHQWHLTQSGIPSVWSQGVSGKNVKVGVVDLGFDPSHIDLNKNYLSDYSKNFDNPSLPISGQSSINLNFDEDIPINNIFLNPDQAYDANNAQNDQWAITGQNYYPLFVDSSLKGKITDFNIDFQIDHQGLQDLDVYLYAINGLYPDDVKRKVKLQGNGNSFSFDINTLTNLLDPLNDQNWQWQDHKLWGLAIKDNDLNIITEAGWIENLSASMTVGHRHGNNVAGVIAALGNNNIQGSGVAPGAGWAALQFGIDGTDDQEIASALNYKNQAFDIYQNSWGYDFYGQPYNPNINNSFNGLNSPSFLWEDTIEDNSIQGRGGKGSIYVFAGGNSKQTGARTDYNAFANSRHTIAVGAVDPNNQAAIYSNPGSSLLISAYSNSGNPGLNDGIVTTDLNNQATNQFGGTSAAAPFVSGVIALMLEVNPNLTWRDVQHILIKTANSEILKASGNQDGWKETIIDENTPIYHHYQYGFGLINPSAAVEMAKSWNYLAPEVSTEAKRSVFGNGYIGEGGHATWELKITEDINIESLELIIKGNHGYRGDLEIILESPNGTKSILSQKHGEQLSIEQQDFYYTHANYDWTFTSLRHWGETSRNEQGDGTWKVTVRDAGNIDNLGALMSSLQLILYGTEPAEWQYTIDSFSDSMAGYDVGGTRYEIYGTAVKETKDSIYFAINTNMPIEGFDSDFAQDGHTAWGDLLFNFSGNSLNTASDNGELFGIRFADNNGAGVNSLGVYANVTAKELAYENGLVLNNKSLAGYINWINDKGGTPTMGDLSVYDPYFKQNEHVPNLIASGTKIGDIEILHDVSQLGLDFGSFGAVGAHTFVLKFDRHLLPSGDYVYTLAPECDNDVIAGVGSLA